MANEPKISIPRLKRILLQSDAMSAEQRQLAMALSPIRRELHELRVELDTIQQTGLAGSAGRRGRALGRRRDELLAEIASTQSKLEEIEADYDHASANAQTQRTIKQSVLDYVRERGIALPAHIQKRLSR